jgi:SMODS-associating 2TM, beta-strand rich effector domain
MWDGVKIKPLVWFIIFVGAVTAFVNWFFMRSTSPIGLWGYVGTAVSGAFIALTALDRWLWPLHLPGIRLFGRDVPSIRLFGWITKKPDVSGQWCLKMVPKWTSDEPFVSDLKIDQTLFSTRIEIVSSASIGRTLSAAIVSTSDDDWALACIYNSTPENNPEKHTVFHRGALLLDIRISKDGRSSAMDGRYWTNKETSLSLADWPKPLPEFLERLSQTDAEDLKLPLHGTAGHAAAEPQSGSRP